MLVLNAWEGGATMSALDFVKRLQARGHSFVVVGPTGRPSTEDWMRGVRLEAIEEVHLPWWNRNHKCALWKRPLVWGRRALLSGFHVATVGKLIRIAARAHIDLIHVNTSLTLDPVLIGWLCRLPVVWHIRELIGSNGLFRFWLPDRWLRRVIYAVSSVVVANSAATAAFFRGDSSEEKLRVVPNGVDLSEFGLCSGTKMRARLGVGEQGILVGMFAHLTSNMKGHGTFISMAGMLRADERLRFVVFGKDPLVNGGFRGEVAYAKSLRALVERTGVDDRLTFAGEIWDVDEALAACDIVVHPSPFESFGRVMVEAGAAERPVVAFDSGGAKEIVASGETGVLVPVGDLSALASAVRELAVDPDLRSRMGKRARLRIREKFSAEVCASGIEEVYQEVASAARE